MANEDVTLVYPWWEKDGKNDIIELRDMEDIPNNEWGERLDGSLPIVEGHTIKIFPCQPGHAYKLPDNMLQTTTIENNQIQFIDQRTGAAIDVTTATEDDWNNVADIRQFGKDCFKNVNNLTLFVYHNYRRDIEITVGAEAFAANNEMANFTLYVPNGTLTIDEYALEEEIANVHYSHINLQAKTLKFADNGILDFTTARHITLRSDNGSFTGSLFKDEYNKKLRIGLLETNAWPSIQAQIEISSIHLYFNEIDFLDGTPADSIIKLSQKIGVNDEGFKRTVLNFKRLTNEHQVNLQINASLLHRPHAYWKTDDSYDDVVYQISANNLSFIQSKISYYNDDSQNYDLYKLLAHLPFSYESGGGGVSNSIAKATIQYQIEDTLLDENYEYESSNGDIINDYIYCGQNFSKIKLDGISKIGEYSFGFLGNKTTSIEINNMDFAVISDSAFANCYYINTLTINNSKLLGNKIKNLGRIPSADSKDYVININLSGTLPNTIPQYFISADNTEYASDNKPNDNSNYIINLNFKDSKITTIDAYAFDGEYYDIRPDGFPKTLQEVHRNFFKGDNALTTSSTMRYNLTHGKLIASDEDFGFEDAVGAFWQTREETPSYWLVTATSIAFYQTLIKIETNKPFPDKMQGICAQAFKNCRFTFNSDDDVVFGGNFKSRDNKSQGGLNFSNCTILQAIGYEAFDMARLNTNSDQEKIGLGFNFANTLLRYLGPKALNIYNGCTALDQNTGSNEEHSIIILPIETLEAIYYDSLPYQYIIEDNNDTHYFKKAELQLYSSGQKFLYPSDGPILKKWLSLSRLCYPADFNILDYCANISTYDLVIHIETGTISKKNIVKQIAIGYADINQIKKTVEKEFYPSEVINDIYENTTYRTEMVYCSTILDTEPFKVCTGALVGVEGIQEYYFNLNNNVYLQNYAIGPFFKDKDCGEFKDYTKEKNIIPKSIVCVGYNEKMGTTPICSRYRRGNTDYKGPLALEFDKLRLPTVAVFKDYQWFYTGEDISEITNNYVNVTSYKLYDSALIKDQVKNVITIPGTPQTAEKVTSLFLSRIHDNTILSTNPLLFDTKNKIEAKDRLTNLSKLEIDVLQTNIDIPNKYFKDWAQIKELIIKTPLIRIGSQAFYDCHGLSTLQISEGLKFIGTNAFIGCINLDKIVYFGSPQQWYSILFSSMGSNPFINTSSELNPRFYFDIDGKNQVWYNEEFEVPRKFANTPKQGQEAYDHLPFYGYCIKGLRFKETSLNSPIIEWIKRYVNDPQWLTPGIEYLIFETLPIPIYSQQPNLTRTLFPVDQVEGKPIINLGNYWNLKRIYITSRENKALDAGFLMDLNNELNYNVGGVKKIQDISVVLPKDLEIIGENAFKNCYCQICDWHGDPNGPLPLNIWRASFENLKRSNGCGLENDYYQFIDYTTSKGNPNIKLITDNQDPTDKTYKNYYFFNNGKNNFLLFIDNVTWGQDSANILNQTSVINRSCLDTKWFANESPGIDIWGCYINTLYLPWLGNCLDTEYSQYTDGFCLETLFKGKDNTGNIIPVRIGTLTLGNNKISHYFDPCQLSNGTNISIAHNIFNNVVFGKVSFNTGKAVTSLGDLILNFKEIIGLIANRNHYNGEHCKPSWPFNLIINLSTIPQNIITSGKDSSDWSNYINNLVLGKVSGQKEYKIQEYALWGNNIKNIYLNQLDAEGKNNIVFENKAFSQNLINENIYFNRPLEEWLNRIEFENATANPLQYCINLYSSNDEGLTYEKRRYVNPKPAKIEGNNIIYYINDYALQGNRQINSFDFNPTAEDNLEGFDPTITYRIKLLTSENKDIKTTGLNNYALIQCFNGTNNQINTPGGWAYAFQPKTIEKTQIIMPKEEEIKNDE